ncbi:DNA polymerase beta-like [Rhopilema esculentum]|uniref:DNA polymerase beta-like n=1 Tax=Rhopilema esculentum TaxID=499914 RepID=UPI0031DDF0EF
MSKRKAPKASPNFDFCDFLIELADYEKNVEKNMFKSKAYRKAASVLADHPTRISSGTEARKLPGIGEQIAKKIDEFIRTGTLEKLEKIRASSASVAINELTQVSGIGPSAAKKLVDDGINSIDDLKKNIEKLNHHQKIGLKHFEDFKARIPRSEMNFHKEFILKKISEHDKDFEACICGSSLLFSSIEFAGAESCGDIDVLATHPAYTSKAKTKALKKDSLRDLVENLKDAGYITETLSLGESKFMGVCKLPGRDNRYCRCDIRLIPFDQFYFGILYFTGSDIFNQAMRQEALEKGFTSNEYCIRPLGSTGEPGEPLLAESEKDIFDIIGKDYVEPMDRNL